MNFRTKLVSSMILLGMFGLASCSSWRERPQLNPHPKYYLTLKGHVAKELRDKIKIRFIQSIAGLSDKCTHITNHFEGVSGNPVKNSAYLAKPDTKGNYELKIPLDKYLPGYCDWQPWAMGITLTDEEYHYEATGLSFINYDNRQSRSTYLKNPKIYNYECPNHVNNRDVGNNCDLSVALGTELPIYLKTKASYVQVVNVNYEEK